MLLPKKWKTREEMWDWIYDPANKLDRAKLLARLSAGQRNYLVEEMHKEALRKRFFNNAAAALWLAAPVIVSGVLYAYLDSFNHKY